MQSELKLSVVSGGSYEAGGNKATWIPRPGSSKVIDLYFRGKRFEVTQEGSGPQGRPRFLVNRTRQPDGKLLQGREIAELIQKLDLFWPDLIELPERLNRIEGTLDRIEKAVAGKRQRPPSGGKLCMSPVCITWQQERYIPRFAPGGFARVPLAAIPASQQMAAGEYRLLQAILFCALGTGLFAVGKKRLGKLAAVPESHVKDFRRSLTNRGLIRPTGRIGDYGAPEYEVLTHPWLVGDNLLVKGGQESAAGGPMEGQRGPTVGPLKTSSKTSTNKTSKKIRGLLAPDGERRLLEEIATVVGTEEIKINGGMWVTRMRGGQWEIKALRNSIEDYWVKTPEQKSSIGNRSGWFTDHYLRNLVKLEQAEANGARKV
jgi:hypothetical protein